MVLLACRLKETLATLPMTRQERLYARLNLVLPLAIVMLSIFWTVSGVLALVQTSAAAATLNRGPLPGWAVTGVVVGGAVAKIALGAAVLWRPWCRRARHGASLRRLSRRWLGRRARALGRPARADVEGPPVNVACSLRLAGCRGPMIYDVLLFLNVVGATVLLGTGAGIASFMVVSNQTRDAPLVAYVAGIIVLADTVLTATATLLKPITGFMIARQVGWPFLEGWIALSFALYVFVGLFWLQVVWMQIRMRIWCEPHAMPARGCPIHITVSAGGGFCSAFQPLPQFWRSSG